jgi:hypothetical protein
MKNFNAQWHYYKRLVQDTPSGSNQMDKKAYKFMNSSIYLDNTDSRVKYIISFMKLYFIFTTIQQLLHAAAINIYYNFFLF